MNESLLTKLVEISWRRKLTPAEELELQSWLASHPEDIERWEAEAGLNLALDRLEPVQPASNFTSQILEKVALERRAAERQPAWGDRLRRFFARPQVRLAWATVFLMVAVLGYQQHRTNQQEQVAQGMQSFTTVAAVASPEVLEDFEIVREMASDPDGALFALLGK